MLYLRTTHEKAIHLLNERILAIKEIPTEKGSYNIFHATKWLQTTRFIIDNIYDDENEHVHNFSIIIDSAKATYEEDEVVKKINFGITTLASFVEEIQITMKNPEFQEIHLPIIIPPIQDSLKKYKTDFPLSKKTAFIMMRFGDTAQHAKIFEAIRTALMKNGIIGLRADITSYHEDVYYNILTYLHGCDFGIAVFEVIEDPKYNPNVAFEVGYLKALGKPVCLLKEKTLERLHTDLIGKNYSQFDINNCESTIE